LLQVRQLSIGFAQPSGLSPVVQDVSFDIGQQQAMALVGESGSGKSLTALSLTGLLPKGCHVSGSIRYQGQELVGLPQKELRCLRGKAIAYIFQEPSACLNPLFTIGYQVAEALALHQPEVKDRHAATLAYLEQVGLQAPATCYGCYPHQLSGGMQQRVMIAMALACKPRLLVADEPTTALDATLQKQILELLKSLQVLHGLSVLLITHNFALVRSFAHTVGVMFRGRMVEQGPTDAVLRAPSHPYTRALIGCIPTLGAKRQRLQTIDYATLTP
jgi:ABC-type dipeptide/oligopeptide/nickel transport system ATPase component